MLIGDSFGSDRLAIVGPRETGGKLTYAPAFVAATRAQIQLLLSIAFYGSYLGSIGSTAAPFLAEDFGLDDSSITFVAGIIGLGALGTIGLTRLADRRGRRRILLLSLGLAPLGIGLIALSPNIVVFTAIALVATVFAGAIVLDRLAV